MDKEHFISDEALKSIQLSFSCHEYWLAYNTKSYFLRKEDVYAFRQKDEAHEFSKNNISEYDNYNVIFAKSLADVLQKITSGKAKEATISSSIKTSVMDEKAFGFNESQLKRTGFAEAFTPELRSQMEQGVPIIQYNFEKEYDGDKVDATLHLKKSATSDYYFLNKFDLQLQKDGMAEAVKQTFYLTRKPGGGEDDNDQKQKHENKYTLKEGYNLLAGRPVYKNLVSNNGQEYQAWVKLNFKNVLSNGNHEMKQYHGNYGFELENVLAKYSIKELVNEQYKKSLVESLHRGNLQKVTFVDKDGKEERLYISPNITLGALNVYDANKQRIPTDILVEKNYIGKELAEQLKERFGQQQKPEQMQKQENTQKQDIGQTQKVSLKQKNEEPIKKPSRKQKIK